MKTTPKNTRITYLYRDAANYKTTKEVVIQGRLAFSDISPLLLDSENFIPQLVGLEGAQADHWHRNGGVATEDDHVLHEITDSDFQPTDDEPTETIQAVELIAAFRKSSADGWPVMETMEALGIPA